MKTATCSTIHVICEVKGAGALWLTLADDGATAAQIVDVLPNPVTGWGATDREVYPLGLRVSHAIEACSPSKGWSRPLIGLNRKLS